MIRIKIDVTEIINRIAPKFALFLHNPIKVMGYEAEVVVLYVHLSDSRSGRDYKVLKFSRQEGFIDVAFDL